MNIRIDMAVECFLNIIRFISHYTPWLKKYTFIDTNIHRHKHSCIQSIGCSLHAGIFGVDSHQSDSSWELPEVPWLTAHAPTSVIPLAWTGRPVYLRNRPLYGIDFSEEMHTTLTLWVVYQYIDKTLYIDIRSWLIQCEVPYTKCISGDMNDFAMAHQFH